MRNFKLLISISIFFWLTSCSVSTFGKFQANEGVPAFIRVGETSKKEVFDTLGEPLVHRFVAGKETVIYNHELGQYFFLYGTYEGHELVIRFENRTVSEVKIEKKPEANRDYLHRLHPTTLVQEEVQDNQTV